MKVLYLHLSAGRALAFVLPDDEARQIIDAVRERWASHDPEQPCIGLGERGELTAWIRYEHITGLELHDPQPAAPTDREAPS